MQSRLNTRLDLLLGFTCVLEVLVCFNTSRGQDYLTPSDVVLGTEKASQEALAQSAGKTTLRLLGLDLFPRASVTAMYDDNLLISSNRPLSDVEWTISPGITAAAGDVSLYLPGSVTLGQIRNLLNYSLLDDSAKPERYVGMDYTPSVNLFTDHSQYDNVDQTAGLSAGYDFARLVLGVDYDFTRWAVKDNSVAGRVTREMNDARLRSRYELTDRSAVEVNCQYHQLDYPNNTYQGYDEIRNDDWFDRKIGARTEIGAGVAFGLVNPQFSSSQTYQQAIVRGIYHVGGKLDARVWAGAEWRHYGAGQGDTLNSVFSLEAIYRPRITTTLTLEGHRRIDPSFDAVYNYEVFGFTAGAAQQLTGQLDVELTCSFENVDYIRLSPGPSNNRSDGYLALSANLNYEFNPHLKAVLFYARREDDSNLPQFTYANNMIGIRLAWRL